MSFLYKLIIAFFSLLSIYAARAQEDNTKLSLIFNDSFNKPYLQLPYLSAVIADATDPAATKGVAFLVTYKNEPLPASGYTLSAQSTDTSVVNNDNLEIIKNNAAATVFITPSGVGYTDIICTVSYKKSIKRLVIHYAASDNAGSANTFWQTGGSDASAAVAIGSRYMLVADDELDRLCLYNRHQSGLPLSSFYYADKLNLTDGSAPFYKEVDVEAGVSSPRIPGRTYWTGSMSNSASFNYKPNRNRLFAVDIKDTGSRTTCSLAGYVDNLRQQLINWGNDYNYKFGKCAAGGQNPKADDGFNIEGMTFAPNGTTLYLGFRAPLVPAGSRTNSVIAPIQNFEDWFGNGRPKGKPLIGKPIELNLGGRSIRDMLRLSNGVYIIVAGSYDEKPDGAIYKWSGNAADSAVLLPGFRIRQLNAEAVLEVDDANGVLVPNALQVLSDNGTKVYYDDNTPAKSLGQINFRKFRSDRINSAEPDLK